MRLKKAEYLAGAEEILERAGFSCRSLSLGMILAARDGRKLVCEVVGKNLPYLSSTGNPAFEWETYIKSDRLDKTEATAYRHNAECWLLYCYVIAREDYKKHFTILANLNGFTFGARLIKASDFRRHMQARSPDGWDVVDLPRRDVLRLTRDVHKI